MMSDMNQVRVYRSVYSVYRSVYSVYRELEPTHLPWREPHCPCQCPGHSPGPARWPWEGCGLGKRWTEWSGRVGWGSLCWGHVGWGSLYAGQGMWGCSTQSPPQPWEWCCSSRLARCQHSRTSSCGRGDSAHWGHCGYSPSSSRWTCWDSWHCRVERTSHWTATWDRPAPRGPWSTLWTGQQVRPRWRRGSHSRPPPRSWGSGRVRTNPRGAREQKVERSRCETSSSPL